MELRSVAVHLAVLGSVERAPVSERIRVVGAAGTRFAELLPLRPTYDEGALIRLPGVDAAAEDLLHEDIAFGVGSQRQSEEPLFRLDSH
jgi:hypothetical protein